MLDVRSFKDVFRRGKRAAENFNRRELKIDAALDDLIRNIDALKEIDYDVTRYEKIRERLMEQVQKAEAVGEKNPKKGYELLEDVKEKARSAAAAAAQELSDQERLPQTRIEVDGIGEVQLHPQAIAGYQGLSAGELREMAAMVGQKIEDGKRLYDALISGEGELPPPSRKAVADLMWFVRVMAESKAGEAFAKGAVTLPDPQRKLRLYLDQVEEVYRRDSSHLKETQTEYHGQARGIDFYEGSLENLDILLPYGMRTVLTQSVATNGGVVLYVKMETEGSRVFPLRKLRDHAESPKNRDWKAVDVKRSVLHGINLLKAHEDGSLASFREQTPKAIADAYAQALAAAASAGDKEIKALLKRGHKFARTLVRNSKKKDQGNSIRINTIIQNFTDFENIVETRRQMKVATDENLLMAVRDCIDAIAKEFAGESVEDLAKRFGGEIQLNEADLERKAETPRQPDEEEIEDELELEERLNKAKLGAEDVEQSIEALDDEINRLAEEVDALARSTK